MATFEKSYASAVAVTITLTSLANGSARQSTEIDNTTNKYLDALVRVKTNGQTGGSATCEVYVFAAVGDTVRSGGAGASDAAFTGQVDELRLLGVIPMNVTTSVTVIFPSVASIFGGVLPEKWGIVLDNNSGAALHATGSEHDVDYQGIKVASV